MKRWMKEFRKFVWVMGVLVLFNCFLTGNAVADKKMFRIGSASLGSAGYIHWEACAFLTNKYAPDLKASSLSTGGSTEATILLDQGKIELAHGTSLEVISAHAGTQPFKNIKACSGEFDPSIEIYNTQ